MDQEEFNTELSIVMPCLNEAETIGTCIQKAQRYLDGNKISGEIIVADNGSTDNSVEIARKLNVRIVNVETRGYGAALMGGISAARGKYIIMGDADDSYDFGALDPFIGKLREGYDLVMGYRFKGGIKDGAMPFLHQFLGNPVLSFIGKLFFHANVSDFHCGLRGFRRDAILRLDMRTTGMEFASEMVVKATLSSLRVTEVPTILYPDGRSRPPHLRTWRDGWRHLRFFLLYSPRWLFLYPGIALTLIGLFLWFWLIPSPRHIGSVVLDVNTLFYASLMIVLGVQALSIAVFTKVFAISEGLLPKDDQLLRVVDRIGLERGLLVGLALIILGIGTAFAALGLWQMRSFGPLDPTLSLRLVIPGGTLIAIGFQVVFSIFFLSILGLKRK